MVRYFLTLCLSLTTALATLSCTPAPPADKYRVSEITFERSGSWGVRNGYTLILREDGMASYAGDVDAKRRGRYLGRVEPAQFSRLAKLVVEGGYFELNDRYRAGVTDTDTVTMSVAYAGGRKSVEDYGRGGGEKLTGIEQAIDSMVEGIEWRKDDE